MVPAAGSTRAVAQATQVPGGAVTACARHQGSLRSVRSVTCARVLAGASVACVILSVLAAPVGYVTPVMTRAAPRSA